MKARHIPLCIAATAAILVCSALFATAASTRVWVFHDEDPNYQTPPFDDVLMALGESGQINLARGGLNIAQTIGGNRVISAADHGESVLVCEFVADRLWKLAADGSPIFSIARPIYAVDVAPSGSIYALEDHTGTIFGQNILHISPEGDVLHQAAHGGFDLVIDEPSRTILVVGADIKCLDFDLNLRWALDPIPWAAVSVDRASDGSAWVAEREHPQVGGSANRLLQISPLGTVVRTIPLAYSPFCVRVDRTDDSVYVAGDRLYKYDPQGVLMFAASLGATGGTFITGWNLALDELGQVWVGTWSDVRKFSPDGALLLSTNLFARPSNTYIAIDQAISHFTELFSAGDNDLAFSSLTFTPDGSASGYSPCRQAVTAFPTDPAGGTWLSLNDDNYASVTLMGTNTVAIYDRRTNVLFVGSNG